MQSKVNRLHFTLMDGVTALDRSKLKISNEDFKLFCAYLEETCGILLAGHKQYLVESRLGRILHDRGVTSLAGLVAKLKQPGNSVLKEEIINAMTTNETLWFRDIHPYDILKNKVLPELSEKLSAKLSGQRLRVWSAACSTGQEPYSISMILQEFKEINRQSFSGEEITATDISTVVLNQATLGEYEMLALGRGLSRQRLEKFFQPGREDSWAINSDIKARVRFRELNLLGPYNSMGQFDIVFCRNVLIYFSSERKQDILRKIHKSLKPGGYLFLGASESISGLTDCYDMIHCRPGIIYQAKK